jgi:hypothetical protein
MDGGVLKRCSRCKTEKPVGAFGSNAAKRDGLQDACRECRRVDCGRYRVANREKLAAADREYAKANPEKGAARSARYYSRLKAQIFGRYGDRCACCGATDNLSVDHINGDGPTQRREALGRSYDSGSTEPLYRWLVANGFPPGFQTLCRRCNASKWTLGSCRIDHASEERTDQAARSTGQPRLEEVSS